MVVEKGKVDLVFRFRCI